MTPPALSEIIYWLQDPLLLVERPAAVVAANSGASRLFRRPAKELVGMPLTALVTDDPENLTRYLRQCSTTFEGIQGGLHIQPSNEEPILCKAMGGLVHQGEERPRWVWLRFLPPDDANGRFTAFHENHWVLAKENEAHLQNEQRWRAAFENSSIAIGMTDFTGRIYAANSVFENMLGYTQSELSQLTFLDITYEEDRKVNLELFRELVEGKRKTFQMEKRYYRKNGSLLWARVNVALAPRVGDSAPFCFAIIEDITGLKRIEEESRLQLVRLQESETRLQAFFENSPSLIFLKDRQGRYLYVNKQFKRALRVAEEQIKGKEDDEVFSAEQAATFQANDRQVLESGISMEFEEVALQEDGLHTSIVQKFPLFNAEGEICAIGGIVTDITARKRAERELLTLRDELTAELKAMTRLHEFSAKLLAISEFQPLLEEVLDATIALQNADFGNIQVFNQETQALEIVAQRGFQKDFLDYFRSVRDAGAACGRAMELGERVVIEDVETDPQYAPHRQIAASAGFRAVQSTPLFSRRGEFLGMLSTHFREPHRPPPRDLRFTDLYARHAAQIIESKRLEAAQRRVEEQYRNVVEAVNDSVVMVSESFNIVFANPATAKTFGYPSAELVGQPLTVLMPESMRQLCRSGFNRYLKTDERHLNWKGIELIGLRKNGEEFPVSISLTESVKNGERVFTGFIRDITDQKQAVEMQLALARVSRLTSMGELAASIAHEVNQPLTAITNNGNACLRLLADSNVEPEVLRRALEEIVADGTRASDVIARIRAFIEKVPAEKNELDINQVIEEVLSLTDRELDENRVRVERQLTKALPRVLGDRVQLQQVLLNLIINGIEAMSAVTDRPRMLWVESGIDESGKVMVAVRDSGAGLGLEPDRVFTPFFTTKGHGMGMGLSISRSLVEGHGGRLWATPNFPHGAVFYFTLPVADRSGLQMSGH